MNPLTADRAAVAATVAAILADADVTGWTVYETPPASIVVPAIVVTPSDPVERRTHGAWSVPTELWLFADALNLEQLEDALSALLVASAATSVEVGQAPAAKRYGGATYLGAVMVLPRVVNLRPLPATPRPAERISP